MVSSENDISKKKPSGKQINDRKLRVKNILDEDDNNNPAMPYETGSLGGLSSQEISNSMVLE